MAKLAGKTGLLKLATVTYPVTQWEGEHIKEFLDTTDTGSAGAQEGIHGIERFNGTFDFFVDSVTLLTALKPAVSGTLELYVSATQTYSFTANIETNRVTMPVAGAVQCSAGFKSNGAITQLA